MARKSPFPDFHMHLPPGVADAAAYCAAFALLVAAAVLTSALAPWS